MKKIILILIILIFLTGCCKYNQTWGCDKSCNVDEDCKCTCDCGCININEECTSHQIACIAGPGIAKCEEGICKFDRLTPLSEKEEVTEELSIKIPESDEIIINSKDWRNVYSGMLYGSLKGIPTSFIANEEQLDSVLNLIPKNKKVALFSSKNNRFAGNYGFLIKNRGFEVEEVFLDNFNIQLAKELDEIKNFIVVDDSYGYNAVGVAPYAVVTNTYVLFANDNSIDDVLNLLNEKEMESLVLYGDFDSSIKKNLSKFDPEIISRGNKFEDNIEIVEKYQEIKHADQVIFTNGGFIEKEIMSGDKPIIFIGNEKTVPTVIIDYITESNDIDEGILIGNDLIDAATYVRKNTPISVFVKFAQGERQEDEEDESVKTLDYFYVS